MSGLGNKGDMKSNPMLLLRVIWACFLTPLSFTLYDMDNNNNNNNIGHVDMLGTM